MFRPLMWTSSGWQKQEYSHNYNVSESIQNLKILILCCSSQLKEYLTDNYKILGNKRLLYRVTVLWMMYIDYTRTEFWSELVGDI